MHRIAFFSIAVLIPAVLIHAQESRGTILGRASDPTGSFVAGAAVRVTNNATNTTVSTTTNEAGNFEVPYLIPGMYTVTVEMPGFKKNVRDKIELRIGDRMRLDFTLSLGEVTESVVVTGETPLLSTATADMGLVMDQRRVAELPVVGGNPFYLARLTAGVLASGGRSAGNPMDQGGATGVIVNGTRTNASEVTVDGSPSMTNRNATFSPHRTWCRSSRSTRPLTMPRWDTPRAPPPT